MTVSIVIMTLNAESTIDALLSALEKQTLVPDEILLCDSESDDCTVAISKIHPLVRVLPIRRSEFDHGGSRHKGFMESKGEIVCFLTQDALPVDENYLAELINVFADPDISCACGRQIARNNSRPEEILTREFNYPSHSFTRSQNDIQHMGIKAYFLSDVCSAYRRVDYLSCNGFARPLLTNEDMLMAAAQLARGKKIAYCSEAKVYHSHCYTLAQDYRRSFDTGVFLCQKRESLPGAAAEAEGLAYVKYVSLRLLKQFRLVSLARFILHCTVRFFGNRDGQNYTRFTKDQILQRTAQPDFWKRYFNAGMHSKGR